MWQYLCSLDWWAKVSSIGAFIITFGGVVFAAFEYGQYKRRWNKKVRILEDYLKQRKLQATEEGKEGKHSINHLIRHCALTQDEILKISFESEILDRFSKENERTGEVELLVGYIGKL